MTRLARDPLYRRHRFPADVIAHAVWLSFRFPLSLWMVEDMLAARGVIVSQQTVRLWRSSAGTLPMISRGDQPTGSATNGTSMRSSSPSVERSTGCGVPSIRMVLFSTLVQSRRNAKAAKRLMRKLLKGRFARARLADDGKRLAGINVEAHRFDGLEDGGPGAKIDRQ
jgi:putative transposase